MISIKVWLIYPMDAHAFASRCQRFLHVAYSRRKQNIGVPPSKDVERLVRDGLKTLSAAQEGDAGSAALTSSLLLHISGLAGIASESCEEILCSAIKSICRFSSACLQKSRIDSRSTVRVSSISANYLAGLREWELVLHSEPLPRAIDAASMGSQSSCRVVQTQQALIAPFVSLMGCFRGMWHREQLYVAVNAALLFLKLANTFVARLQPEVQFVWVGAANIVMREVLRWEWRLNVNTKIRFFAAMCLLRRSSPLAPVWELDFLRDGDQQYCEVFWGDLRRYVNTCNTPHVLFSEVQGSFSFAGSVPLHPWRADSAIGAFPLSVSGVEVEWPEKWLLGAAWRWLLIDAALVTSTRALYDVDGALSIRRGSRGVTDDAMESIGRCALLRCARLVVEAEVPTAGPHATRRLRKQVVNFLRMWDRLIASGSSVDVHPLCVDVFHRYDTNSSGDASSSLRRR